MARTIKVFLNIVVNFILCGFIIQGVSIIQDPVQGVSII